MRLPHKIMVFSHKLCTQFEAVNYHTKQKEKTKHSALHFDTQFFFYFSKCFHPHTKFVNLKLKKNYKYVKIFEIFYLNIRDIAMLWVWNLEKKLILFWV